MEITKETAAFQIMHKYIAILQFLYNEMHKLIVLGNYAFVFLHKLYRKIPF